MAKVVVSEKQWRKSSHSVASNDCVEVVGAAEGVAVRDSKRPDGPVLVFRRPEWRAFLSAAKAGEFDDLA